MPNYDYKCEACEHQFEKWQSFKEDELTQCPECKQEKLRRLFGIPFVYTKGEAKTIGQQAERNSQKMGRAEVEEREAKITEKKAAALKAQGLTPPTPGDTPWWRNGSVKGMTKSDKPLTPVQVEKYKQDLEGLGCKVNINAPPPKELKDESAKQRESTT